MNCGNRWFWFQNSIAGRQELLIYILKWSFLGITTGIVAAIGVTIFLKLLTWSIAAWTQNSYYYFFIPGVLLLNSWLVNQLAPHVAGGSDKVIEAIHQRYGYLQLSGVAVKIVATVMTIAAGGSAGKEGPAAQIGATLAAAWAGLLSLNHDDRRKIVICGLSAGFACVFGTPVAGAIFGVEVLFVGKVLYDTLYPAFVAGLTGYYACQFAGIPYFYQYIHVQPGASLMLEAIVLGLICGLMAVFFIKVLIWNQKFFSRLQLSKPKTAFVGGILLVFIGHFVSPLYLGLGLELLEAGITGETLAGDAFFWKTLATGITLGCGGTGGIITPVLVVGTVTGNLFGQLLASPAIAVYSVIGMVALLAGAVNTPLAAVIMAAELFGSDIIPYAAVGCLVSYVVSEHRSIYPSQIIFTGKRPCLCEDEGKSVGCIDKEKKMPVIIDDSQNIQRNLE